MSSSRDVFSDIKNKSLSLLKSGPVALLAILIVVSSVFSVGAVAYRKRHSINAKALTSTDLYDTPLAADAITEVPAKKNTDKTKEVPDDYQRPPQDDSTLRLDGRMFNEGTVMCSINDPVGDELPIFKIVKSTAGDATKVSGDIKDQKAKFKTTSESTHNDEGTSLRVYDVNSLSTHNISADTPDSPAKQASVKVHQDIKNVCQQSGKEFVPEIANMTIRVLHGSFDTKDNWPSFLAAPASLEQVLKQNEQTIAQYFGAVVYPENVTTLAEKQAFLIDAGVASQKSLDTQSLTITGQAAGKLYNFLRSKGLNSLNLKNNYASYYLRVTFEYPGARAASTNFAAQITGFGQASSGTTISAASTPKSSPTPTPAPTATPKGTPTPVPTVGTGFKAIATYPSTCYNGTSTDKNANNSVNGKCSCPISIYCVTKGAINVPYRIMVVNTADAGTPGMLNYGLVAEEMQQYLSRNLTQYGTINVADIQRTTVSQTVPQLCNQPTLPANTCDGNSQPIIDNLAKNTALNRTDWYTGVFLPELINGKNGNACGWGQQPGNIHVNFNGFTAMCSSLITGVNTMSGVAVHEYLHNLGFPHDVPDPGNTLMGDQATCIWTYYNLFSCSLSTLDFNGMNTQPVSTKGFRVLNTPPPYACTLISGLYYANLISTSTGDCVKNLQWRLNHQNIGPAWCNCLVTINGVMDAPTVSAIKQYQTRFGLSATGIVDKYTWGYIIALST